MENTIKIGLENDEIVLKFTKYSEEKKGEDVKSFLWGLLKEYNKFERWRRFKETNQIEMDFVELNV